VTRGRDRNIVSIVSDHDGRSDLTRRLPKIELLATALLGTVTTAFADLQLGVATWAVGLLLAVNQVRIAQRLDAELAPVRKLAEYVDLGELCDINAVRQLADAYMKVAEPEFAAPKNEVVNAAREELVRLRTEKTSAELATGAYYSWLLPMLNDTTRGQRISALSLMMSCEWDDSAVEQQFIESNVRAAERGVRVDRIFVMPASQLTEARGNPAVRQHFSDQGPVGLRGHFVDADRLARDDSALAGRLGDGFIAFDDQLALIDLHSTDGSARGKVTKRAATLREIRRTFDELFVHSRPLTPELLEYASAAPTPLAPVK
jgi:hypothetical protein